MPDPFDRIVELCAVRDRSRAELAQRLTREGHGNNAVEQAIERAERCGLVDDVRFADAFVRGRVRAGKGEAAIRRDLDKHGIDPTKLPNWPCGYGLEEDEQVDRAIAFLEAHPPTAKDAYQAAFRKLVGRGYPKHVAMRAVRSWYDHRDA